jgi:hypothetical protein
MNGVDKIKGMASSDFAPVPVGNDLPITLTTTGAGTVNMTFTPLFYRAW